MLPHLATAAGVLIVALREGLMRGEPETLRKKDQQKNCGDALGKIESEAAKRAKLHGLKSCV